MEMKLRIKVLENFKDGRILEGKFLPAGSIHIVSEIDAQKIENSGGLIEVLEKVIPNPLKIQKEEQAEISSYREVQPAADAPKPGQTPVKRGKGRKK